MDWLTIISSTTLLGVSANLSPLYDFSYEYYDGYSSVAITDGSSFYRPKYPEISLQGLTHVENTGLIWSVTSPFMSQKYSRGWNFGLTAYHDILVDSMSRIRISAKLTSLASETSRSCSDDVGRLFHCYHGTQPNSPYYFLPYSKVENSLYRNRRSTNIAHVALTWIAIF